MDILLNDDSMIMQFTDESFSEYMLREVLPIMKQLEKSVQMFLKNIVHIVVK